MKTPLLYKVLVHDYIIATIVEIPLLLLHLYTLFILIFFVWILKETTLLKSFWDHLLDSNLWRKIGI